MITTITGLELNITKVMGGKEHKGHNITYQPPAYKNVEKPESTRFVFANSEFAAQLKGIEVGDTVEITFDETRYKNPATIKKVDKVATPPVGKQSASSPTGSRAYTPNTSDDRQESIVRQSALKQAINLIAVLKDTGAYSAANLKKKEFVVQEVVEIAQAFEPYLFAKIDTEQVETVDVPWEDVEQDG